MLDGYVVHGSARRLSWGTKHAQARAAELLAAQGAGGGSGGEVSAQAVRELVLAACEGERLGGGEARGSPAPKRARAEGGGAAGAGAGAGLQVGAGGGGGGGELRLSRAEQRSLCAGLLGGDADLGRAPLAVVVHEAVSSCIERGRLPSRGEEHMRIPAVS